MSSRQNRSTTVSALLMVPKDWMLDQIVALKLQGNVTFDDSPFAEVRVEVERVDQAVYVSRPELGEHPFSDYMSPEHQPDAYVKGIVEARINGMSATREELMELLEVAVPTERVGWLRQAVERFAERGDG